ncbi:hypothetical protein SAMN02745196_02260 [Clostridium collagenovorans DSM 3089]|uniref:DUF1989 domain-containing protein n=1 Tax=Clostridium collagenovorans DSM 3089 TaxID=1121306 RepID=A0A1M5XHT6_9CLOT|nr:urea carboxylase-associated family protein [Clostridium collagenovorans]SHH99309.1 hypothetical protein SAMN02745196_02260 [Clostridium collagenovorans DSM 3089]
MKGGFSGSFELGIISLKIKMEKEFIVEGGYGKAFTVLKDRYLTIEVLEGSQVVDFMFFREDNIKESFSSTKTKTKKYSSSITIGDTLVSNMWRPMVEIVEDTVGTHDLNMAACNDESYTSLGIKNHRSCEENFRENLKPYGIKPWDIPDPLNLFQKTVIDSTGKWERIDSVSKAGDRITFKFLKDCICAISVCPYDMNGFNGGKATPVLVKIYK